MTPRRVAPIIMLASLLGAAAPAHAYEGSETCPPESCIQLTDNLYLEKETNSGGRIIFTDGGDCVLLDLNQLVLNLKHLEDVESVKQLINPIGGTYNLSCITSSGYVHFLGTFPITPVA